MRIPSFIFFVLVAGLICRAETPPTIDAHDDAARPIVTADLPPELARRLAAAPLDPDRVHALLRFVRLSDRTGSEGPPIFGTYSLNGNTLRFVPDFPLSPGGRYRAVFSLFDHPSQRTDYALRAAATGEAPRIENIYPSSDTLPANLLKFYIHFSVPVRQTDHIFDQIHILDEAGKTVYDPWRRFQQWSDDGKRLTLWVHPGRVKQGVNLREDFGPVLQPKHKYTLVIDADVLDLSGRPMSERFEKKFGAIEEDHNRPSLDTWRVAPPKAGTRDPLIVTFPKPLDRALIQRLITVHDASDAALEGRAEPGENEMSWYFTPTRPWSPQVHTLRGNDLLEDLAGNTPVRVFDADMQHPDTRPAVSQVPFTPKQ